MTPVRALGLEVPNPRLLATHGDLHQQPPIQWQPLLAAAPAPEQPDEADQPMLEGQPDGPPEAEPIDAGAENDHLRLLGDGQGRQSPTKKDGEAMKDSERSGENDPNEEKAN